MDVFSGDKADSADLTHAEHAKVADRVLSDKRFSQEGSATMGSAPMSWDQNIDAMQLNAIRANTHATLALYRLLVEREKKQR